MGGCAAPNCRNRTGVRLFTFPKDEERKKLWLTNAKLNFVGRHARLCEVHFDDYQFERQRQDGWKKLRHDAIPVLFDEPIRVYRISKDQTEPDQFIEIVPNVHQKRKYKSHARKSKQEVAKKRCKEEQVDDSDVDDPIIKTSEVSSINTEPIAQEQISIVDDIVSENASLLDDIARIQAAAKQISKIDPKSQTLDKTSLNTAKGNKLIALLKQWNEVLKDELRDFGKLHETVLIRNEVLQEKVDKLEKQNQELKCENNIIKNEVKEFEKRNKEMYLVINEFSKHNNTLSDKVNDLRSQSEDKIALKVENELLQNQKKELENQSEILMEENTSMLEEIQEFVKNNKAMTQVILQLEKHNHAISCKLKNVENENKSMSIRIEDLENVMDEYGCKVSQRKKKQCHQMTKGKKYRKKVEIVYE